MQYIRSLIFHIIFFSWTAFAAFCMLPVLIIPRKMMVKVVIALFSSYIPLERYILKLDYEVRGWENIPEGPCILALKHQSMYETVKLHPLFGDVSIILKRELMWIPFWGWYQWKSGVIPVNRSAGSQAIPQMLESAREVVASGRSIAIFPQGTRVKPFVSKPYKSGIYAIYEELKLPIVPIALNTGVFWPKCAFLIKPGKVVFDILPVIPAGLDRAEIKGRVEKAIEEGSDRLCREAEQLMQVGVR